MTIKRFESVNMISIHLDGALHMEQAGTCAPIKLEVRRYIVSKKEVVNQSDNLIPPVCDSKLYVIKNKEAVTKL